MLTKALCCAGTILTHHTSLVWHIWRGTFVIQQPWHDTFDTKILKYMAGLIAFLRDYINISAIMAHCWRTQNKHNNNKPITKLT